MIFYSDDAYAAYQAVPELIPLLQHKNPAVAGKGNLTYIIHGAADNHEAIHFIANKRFFNSFLILTFVFVMKNRGPNPQCGFVS